MCAFFHRASCLTASESHKNKEIPPCSDSWFTYLSLLLMDQIANVCIISGYHFIQIKFMITLACPTTVANFPSKRNPIKSKKIFHENIFDWKISQLLIEKIAME